MCPDGHGAVSAEHREFIWLHEGWGVRLLMQGNKEEVEGQSKAWERTWEIQEAENEMNYKCLFNINISHPGRTLFF